jgi:hypothetical protein
MLTLAVSLLAQFPPVDVPKPPDLPKPPGLPGASPSSGNNDNQIVEEPRFIYKLFRHPELPVQFDKLSEEQLIRIIRRAKRVIPSKEEYQARKLEEKRYMGSVHSLKGFILEEVFLATQAYQELLAWAKERASEEGIAPSDVVLIQDLQDARKVQPKDKEAFQGWAALTDGVLAAVIPELSEDMAKTRYKDWRDQPLLDAEGKPVPGKFLRIYAVIESKTPGQAEKLVKGRKGDAGQVVMDFERFFELPLRFGEGEEFQPERVFISRKKTRWITVVPHEWRSRFSAEYLQALDKAFQTELKDFNHKTEETQVLNEKAEVVADNVFYCLYVRDFFKDY